MAEKNMNAKISVEFEETANRQQLSSGDNLPTLFGKIKKFFTDLKAVAFSGSYIDLSDRPTTATADTDGLMSAEDKGKLDDADNRYALKSKYGDTTINVGRKAGTAVGECSTAEGNYTTASGTNSHAGGWCTEALHDNEVSYGKYNKSNNNTLFSIGDGTADDARHNAFEITTTGGKLHDKDIATTDIIPDLSAYAKKSDIPTELPANGGNADYAANAGNSTLFNGKPLNDIFISKTLQSVSDIDNTDGNWSVGIVTSWEGVSGTFPDNCPSWVVINQYKISGDHFVIQICYGVGINRIWMRGKHVSGSWGNWGDVYSLDNKPYVTGEIAFANQDGNNYTNSPVPTNHGFMPSKVLYWALSTDCPENLYQVYSAISFDEKSFIPHNQYGHIGDDVPSFKYGYIIFK